MANPGPSNPRITYWDAIKEWLRQDADISAFLTDVEFEHLKVSETDRGIWAVATEYQGFNVVKMIKTLYTRHGEYPKSASNSLVSSPIKVNGTEKVFNYSANEPFFKDIAFLIMVFSTRGSNYTRIYQKSNEFVRPVLDHLKNKFAIDTNVRRPGQSISSDVVTMPRIAACFPAVVCDYFRYGNGKSLYSLSDLGISVGNPWYKVFLTTQFICVIPDATYRRYPSLRVLVFLCHILADKVISH